MASILIGESDFECIRVSIGKHYWENSNLSYPLGYWIPARVLQTIPGYGSEFMPIIEIPDLPVFYGNINTDQDAYSESLTCLCVSRGNGSEVKGVSILPAYWYEPQYFEFKRCFRYQEWGDSEHCWRIVSCRADIDWLMGCWDEPAEFFIWLRQNAWI